MVAVAILGGIAVGFNTIMQNMTKSNLKAQTDSEMLLTFNEMIAIFSDSINCKASLQTKLATGDTINQLSYKGAVRFPINTAFGNNKMKFQAIRSMGSLLLILQY